ncbi:MAG: hypothetical protein FWH43_02705 [Endomicrobia bacterium]|nr:hypothetical protein [Endomicrobiia bacterium]
MYIDFASDWPAYFFMAVFVVFLAYVMVKGRAKVVEDDVAAVKTNETKKK